MENLLPVFVAITGLAVILQAGILVAMYLAVRKSSERTEALVVEIKTKALPALESATQVLNDARPKLATILENLEHSTTTIRAQVTRIDAASNDALDRGRLQLLRADELVSRTLDRFEQTSTLINQTVVNPVRQVSGVIAGITAGLEYLLANRATKAKAGADAKQTVPQDEMFI